MISRLKQTSRPTSDSKVPRWIQRGPKGSQRDLLFVEVRHLHGFSIKNWRFTYSVLHTPPSFYNERILIFVTSHSESYGAPLPCHLYDLVAPLRQQFFGFRFCAMSAWKENFPLTVSGWALTSYRMSRTPDLWDSNVRKSDSRAQDQLLFERLLRKKVAATGLKFTVRLYVVQLYTGAKRACLNEWDTGTSFGYNGTSFLYFETN
jgi:hypothetical protein